MSKTRSSFPALIGILLHATLFAQAPPRAVQLPEALASGRISAQFTGSGVDEVRMHLALLRAPEFELEVPAGLLLAPADQASQSVVTCMTVFYRVTKASATSTLATDPIVPVCLTKLDGKAPLRIPLSLLPQDNPDVTAVLKIVDKYLARTPIAQAAVWIAGTDASWADLGRLRTSTNLIGTESSATIQPAHMAAALMFLDLASVDYSRRSIWKDAKRICEMAIPSKTHDEMTDELKAQADNWCRNRVLKSNR